MIDVNSVKFKNSLILPINGFYDCSSKDCIHILFCMKFQVVYIGETKQCMKDRLNQHINTIKSFIAFTIILKLDRILIK